MRHIIYLAALLVCFASSPVLQAGDSHGKCCPVCNSCDYVCQFSAEKTREEKTDFQVECKAICIPPITFPWEKGHGKGKGGDCTEPSRCGKVKIVRVLVKETYECTRCKCKWTAVPIDGKKHSEAGEASSSSSDVPPPIPVVEAAAVPERREPLVNLSNLTRRFMGAVAREVPAVSGQR